MFGYEDLDLFSTRNGLKQTMHLTVTGVPVLDLHVRRLRNGVRIGRNDRDGIRTDVAQLLDGGVQRRTAAVRGGRPVRRVSVADKDHAPQVSHSTAEICCSTGIQYGISATAPEKTTRPAFTRTACRWLADDRSGR